MKSPTEEQVLEMAMRGLMCDTVDEYERHFYVYGEGGCRCRRFLVEGVLQPYPPKESPLRISISREVEPMSASIETNWREE